jgi:hypothetical protein
MVSRSIYNLKLDTKIDTIHMYDIPFDRSFLQLSNGIGHVIPSTDTKPELTAKASMAQPLSQPVVYANGLIVCSVSQPAVSKSVYVAPNDRIVINDELQTYERKRFWLNLKNYSKISVKTSGVPAEIRIVQKG